jgi:hypothetical protein
MAFKGFEHVTFEHGFFPGEVEFLCGPIWSARDRLSIALPPS